MLGRFSKLGNNKFINTEYFGFDTNIALAVACNTKYSFVFTMCCHSWILNHGFLYIYSVNFINECWRFLWNATIQGLLLGITVCNACVLLSERSWRRDMWCLSFQFLVGGLPEWPRPVTSDPWQTRTPAALAQVHTPLKRNTNHWNTKICHVQFSNSFYLN